MSGQSAGVRQFFVTNATAAGHVGYLYGEEEERAEGEGLSDAAIEQTQAFEGVQTPRFYRELASHSKCNHDCFRAEVERENSSS